jgi:formylglycine-generating enzyme required for sulfatase activity
MHTGAAEERGGDYFGPTVNRVARVLAAGHGGQILLSNATEQLVRDHLTEGTSLSDLGERSLKNLTRTERIFQLNVADQPSAFPTLRSVATRSPAHRRRRMLIYGSVSSAAIIVLAGLMIWSPRNKPSSQDSNTPSLQQSIASAAALKLLGNVFTNAVGAEMVYIPPGEFMMGSTKEEQAWAVANGSHEEHVKREGDAPRKTRIKQGFWMGRTEVTVGQWKQFVKETGYVTDCEKRGSALGPPQVEGKPWEPVEGMSWKEPKFFALEDNQAVTCISWNDAMAFCGWLTERERKSGRLPAGLAVRLPTEAEWEYACRAGTQTKFWWGESKEDGKDRLNWHGKDEGFELVAPVVDSYGARGRNGFGLADMLGNVWEWCLDKYDATHAHEECYQGNPGSPRVLRGGSFDLDPTRCRCVSRYGNSPSDSNCHDGFRVAVGVAR